MLQPIHSRVEEDLIEWLDAQRGPGETRSHVVRRILEVAQKADRKVEAQTITWRFPKEVKKG